MIRVFVVVFALAVPGFGSPQSPCPDVFLYERTTEPGRWYGVATLTTPSTLYALWLNIVLDGKAIILGNWIGDVSTKDNKDFKIENSDLTLTPESPLKVRFYVQYNPQYKTPRLVAIRMNGREICHAKSSISTVISVHQDVFVPDQPSHHSDSKYQNQCGKVLFSNASPLIVNGALALEGQWPWQVALYQTLAVDNKYICGGTLVSRRNVITAAHCVPRKSFEDNKNVYTVYLGKHNLRTSVVGVQVRLVEKILVHPDYNPSIYSRDIAILKLNEPVIYTDRVQPACLWPEDKIHLSYVIGDRGMVAGWGFDENGMATEELMKLEMPVVDTETCIRSYSDFFLKFTSDYTYCAGDRDGSSVCSGDSGGGMAFKVDKAWHLRGVVSLSVAPQNELRCDPSHYVIFTDVAKFLPWIKKIVIDF